MMPKTTIYKIALTIPLLVLLILSPGCQKAPINGDLDGQWQIMSVEPEAPETIISERLYYCFYMHSCMLTYYGGVATNGKFIYKDDVITMEFPYATTPSLKAQLKQYGIYSNPVTFTIEHLDKKKLILRDGDVVVTMRKF